MSSLFSSLPCTPIQTHLVLNILIKSSICVYMTRRGVEEKSRIISASCTKDMKSSSFRHEIGNWEWMKSCWRWHKRKNMRETTANVSWKCHNFATKLSKNNLSLFCFEAPWWMYENFLIVQFEWIIKVKQLTNISIWLSIFFCYISNCGG